MWTGDTHRVWRRWALPVLLLLPFAGCRQDMHDQPKIEPLEANAFWADGMGSRPIPAGTVARGLLKADSHLHAGKDDAGRFVESLPASLELDRALLERGRDRYEIYCNVCHDSAGNGTGMIVRRGFKKPPSFHEDRLKAVPLGYIFDVATNGFGLMSGYRNQIPVADRWAIAAYLRVLQHRQVSVGEHPEVADRVREAEEARAAGAADASASGHGEESHHE